MDTLSGVLKSVSLEGAVYLNAEFTAPWCLLGRHGITSLRERLAGAEHVVFFHFLTEGKCKVRLLEGKEELDVSAGDVVLFPQDDRHLIGSDLRVVTLTADDKSPRPDGATLEDFIHLRHGGGEVTRFVCGYLACSRSVLRPLLEALPRVLRIPIGNVPSAELLRELLRLGVRESSSSRPGAQTLLARLAELMFVEALRSYAESMPPRVKGWLAGVRDTHVGRALALLHAEPDRTWTVDELARAVALSRSALAERFTELVGEPPMRYLTRWRLALAARTLRSSRQAIARVAEAQRLRIRSGVQPRVQA